MKWEWSSGRTDWQSREQITCTRTSSPHMSVGLTILYMYNALYNTGSGSFDLTSLIRSLSTTQIFIAYSAIFHTVSDQNLWHGYMRLPFDCVHVVFYTIQHW